MLADLHIHAMGHGEREQKAEVLEPFIQTALAAGIGEIGFTDHDWVQAETDFDLIRRLQERYPQIKILAGLEVDYMDGREGEIRARLKDQPYDYVLGGVHHLGPERWPFDMSDYRSRWQEESDVANIYRAYFQTVTRAAKSGLFQILPHLDLIKVFGYRPAGPALPLLGKLLETLRDLGLVVEINTAGLYKPVQEIYPSPTILAACCRLGIPVSFGSDAHQAGHVGRSFADARHLALSAGYRHFVTLHQKKRIVHRIV